MKYSTKTYALSSPLYIIDYLTYSCFSLYSRYLVKAKKGNKIEKEDFHQMRYI